MLGRFAQLRALSFKSSPQRCLFFHLSLLLLTLTPGGGTSSRARSCELRGGLCDSREWDGVVWGVSVLANFEIVTPLPPCISVCCQGEESGNHTGQCPETSADQGSAVGGRGRAESCCYRACPPDGARASRAVAFTTPGHLQAQKETGDGPMEPKEVPRALCLCT